MSPDKYIYWKKELARAGLNRYNRIKVYYHNIAMEENHGEIEGLLF